jgi:hypothetical protein
VVSFLDFLSAKKKITTKVAVVHKWLSERYSLDDAYFKDILLWNKYRQICYTF